MRRGGKEAAVFGLEWAATESQRGGGREEEEKKFSLENKI